LDAATGKRGGTHARLARFQAAGLARFEEVKGPGTKPAKRWYACQVAEE
jgi:hypothetical protein